MTCCWGLAAGAAAAFMGRRGAMGAGFATAWAGRTGAGFRGNGLRGLGELSGNARQLLAANA